MANNENLIPIPGRLHSVTTEGHVSGANEIFDDTLNKDQATINSEVNAALGTGGSVDSRIAAAINALDSEKSQTAGSDGLALSVTEVDGKITSISGSIAANTYDANGAAATAKTEVIGGATSSGNTLKKLEDRVSPLEAAVGSGGSIDTRISNAVNAAKSELKGNATSACDTLGEAEALIAAEAAAREAADTALDGRVDTLEDVVGTGGSVDSRIFAAVATETTRAQAAEADRYTKSETYTKTEVNGLVDTPHQEYVTVATYASLPASGSADTIYRVSSYDGANSQVDDTVYSEYAWDGTQYVFLCVKSQIDEVFDITVYNSNTKYADLAAALGVDGANIPATLRRGGMSVKYVQSSDNKYEQWRLISSSFNTTVANWQKQGAEVNVSQNLSTGHIDIEIGSTTTPVASVEDVVITNESPQTVDKDMYYNTNSISIGSTFTSAQATLAGTASGKITVNPNEKYKIIGKGNAYAVKTFFITDSDNKVTRFSEESTTDEIITIGNGERYLYFNLLNYDKDTDGVWQIVQTPLNSAVEGLIRNGSTVVFKYNVDNIAENYAYNFGNNAIGSIYTGGMSVAAGFACQIIPLEDADYIELYALGNLYVYRGYMFVDADNRILSKADSSYDTRDNGIILSIPNGAKRMYINYDSYDSNKDKANICKYVDLNTDYKIAKYPLFGKNIVCFGDSITEFEQYQMGYPDWLSFFSGANVTKVGVGGTQLRQRTTPISTPTSTDEAYAALDIVNMIKASCEQDFTKQEAAALYLYNNTGDDNREIVTRLAAINWSEVDGIVVFGGTNDWNNASAYWGNEDDNSFDTTFGAINKIIQLVSTTYPKVKIYWMTPIVRWIGYEGGTGLDENFSDVLVSGTMTLRQFAQKVYDIVKSNHIPVCDLYNSLGWNKYNFSSYFLDNDGTHPYKGFKELGKNIYNFILRYNTL